MIDVLFVQGAGDGAHDEWDIKLVDDLASKLGPAYDVRFPRMPNEADPHFHAWQPVIERELSTLRDDAVVVGHSVGGTMLINTLAHLMPAPALRAVVLIAAPFVGDGGWPAGDITPLPNLGERLPRGVPVFLFHGDQDTTVPQAHVDLYARAIRQAQVRRLSGRDHQMNDDLSEVAAELRKLGGTTQ